MNERYPVLGKLASDILTCGWEDNHKRAHEAGSELAGTVRKQQQRGRCMAGGAEAERLSRLQCGGSQPGSQILRSVLELRFMVSGRPVPLALIVLCILNNTPVIFEITEGVCFFPQSSVTYRKAIGSHTGG